MFLSFGWYKLSFRRALATLASRLFGQRRPPGALGASDGTSAKPLVRSFGKERSAGPEGPLMISIENHRKPVQLNSTPERSTAIFLWDMWRPRTRHRFYSRSFHSSGWLEKTRKGVDRPRKKRPTITNSTWNSWIMNKSDKMGSPCILSIVFRIIYLWKRQKSTTVWGIPT